MTHLSFKIFPYGTAFDVILVDSPIFNRNIVHGITNIIWWKFSITATNSSKGSIDTTNLPQRIIGQWKGILDLGRMTNLRTRRQARSGACRAEATSIS